MDATLPMESISSAITTLLLLVLSNGFAASSTDDSTSIQCNQTYSCLDCTTSQLCRPTVDGELEFLKAINCPIDAPYCQFDSGSCGKVPDPSCGEEDDFICLADGYFPDADDCTVYHYCNNLIPHKFYCSIPGETFNPNSQQCESNHTCSTFECPGRGRKTPHNFDPAYYVYCQSSLLAYVVDRCPPYYALNVTSQLCEPHCTKDGVIPSADSCLEYFLCQTVYLGSNTTLMTSVRQTCADGTGFDTSQMNCTPLTDFECNPTNGRNEVTTAVTASTEFTIPTN